MIMGIIFLRLIKKHLSISKGEPGATVKINESDSLEDYSGQFKLRLPRSLHRLLAEHSKREGISMNQYCVYLLSRNDAFYAK